MLTFASPCRSNSVTHSSAAPFFLGLVLGDYVAGSFWAILGPALHLTTYKIFI